MNKDDILVCIKPFFKEQTWHSQERNIKVGEHYKIDSIYLEGISKDGRTTTSIDSKYKYEDIERITITNDGILKTAFYNKKLYCRHYIHDYFVTLAEWRDKQINSILEDE